MSPQWVGRYTKACYAKPLRFHLSSLLPPFCSFLFFFAFHILPHHPLHYPRIIFYVFLFYWRHLQGRTVSYSPLYHGCLTWFPAQKGCSIKVCWTKLSTPWHRAENAGTMNENVMNPRGDTKGKWRKPHETRTIFLTKMVWSLEIADSISSWPWTCCLMVGRWVPAIHWYPRLTFWIPAAFFLPWHLFLPLGTGQEK